MHESIHVIFRHRFSNTFRAFDMDIIVVEISDDISAAAINYK